MTDKIIEWNKYYTARQATLDDLAGMEFCEKAKRELNGICKPTLSDRAARSEEVYDLNFVEREADRAATIRGQQSAIDFENLIKMAHDYIALCPNDTPEMVIRRLYKYWEAMYRGEWIK